MRKTLIIAAVMLTASFTQADEPVQKFGTLIYPARGNIQWDEGTVEAHVIWGFDTYQNVNAYGCPWDIQLPREKAHYVLMYVNWSNAFSQVGYGDPLHRYVSTRYLDWKRGEAHHIAFVWRGNERSIYLDGEPTRTNTYSELSENVMVEGWMHGDLTEATILAGYGGSLFALDEYRISSVARSRAELAANVNRTLPADRFTLLLDHCDGNGPAVIAQIPGNAVPYVHGSHEVVDGQFGKAMRMWTGPDWQPNQPRP